MECFEQLKIEMKERRKQIAMRCCYNYNTPNLTLVLNVYVHMFYKVVNQYGFWSGVLM
jgi:hypothetical protein